MNTLAAKELKRRGVIALEERLSQGPVHILKNNNPVCVVMSETEFEHLTRHNASNSSIYNNNLWDCIINKPVTGKCTREEIDSRINADRDNWD